VLELEPIGVLRTPFSDRSSAPRQPAAASEARGRIELHPGAEMEHAVSDLERWSHVWVIFWFHLNQGWRPRVAPPRSRRKRGVLATRSPHRPNPLGLSALALERVEGFTLHVRGVDMVDGTPVLDIKPYVPYTDAIDAGSGWLGEAEGLDPGPRYRVSWEPPAREQLRWLSEHNVELRAPVEELLSLGPTPHPYRRIKPDGEGFRLGHRDFRLWFRVEGQDVTVFRIGTGYRRRVLADPGAEPRADTPLEVHRAFVARFGG
jgi:tRNA-Thr(GGU) m(6)t(6)A37 methyltransferase TsaA